MEQIKIQSIDELEKYKSVLQDIKIWVCSTSCGKSYLCSIDDRFFDLDCYQWEVAARGDENYEQRAIEKMFELIKEGKIVTQASHKYFLKYLDENKIPFVWCYGRPEVQDEYCARMLHRGSGEEFVQKFGTIVASGYKDKTNDKRPTVKIEFNRGEFASDYLWKVFGSPSKYINFCDFSDKKYKIAFVDIDDTLLDVNGKLTDFTINSIQKIKDQIKIVLISARSKESVLPIMHQLGLDRECDHAICGYGSMVINGMGEVVYVDKISQEDFDFFISSADKNFLNGCYFNTTNGRIFYNDISDIKKFYNDNLVYKIVKRLKNDEKFEFSDKFLTKFNIFAGEDIIQIVNKSCEKFSAAQRFLSENKLNLKDVIVFGDSEPDLKLLENAGCGVAVCNASWDIKNRAKYIADSNNDDGVAKALLKILTK